MQPKGEKADSYFWDFLYSVRIFIIFRIFGIFGIFGIIKSRSYFVFSSSSCVFERTPIIAISFLILKARFDSAFHREKVNMGSSAILEELSRWILIGEI